MRVTKACGGREADDEILKTNQLKVSAEGNYYYIIAGRAMIMIIMRGRTCNTCCGPRST